MSQNMLKEQQKSLVPVMERSLGTPGIMENQDLEEQKAELSRGAVLSY